MNSVYLGRCERLGDLTLLKSGKVRDIYEVDAERLCFVTSDRVSAFDVQMRQGIPHKGRVLTQVAAHWFERTRDIIPNHLLSTDVATLPGLSDAERDALDGRTLIVRRCEPTTVEWVVRGYLCGSGWKEYQEKGSVCGIELPAGLPFCGKLDDPILTPTTKDDDHDLPLTLDEARERVGDEVFEPARDASMALFERGTKELAEIGILLADTKFEFGLLDGELLLIDEALTPDSSRFWPAESYETGRNQPSFDKQILRDWLETLDWDKSPPAPDLPQDLVERISRRYLEIGERICGASALEGRQ
ncbi:MAG TPA: phosphoribosylaminoimidazolesuccinocarboxamide synthase [Planctomycetes bacterium]|nr:phosphoribosylaminoimidazolesuccinocarboxamide synthase [Planctomycetota bacterium]